MKAGWEVKPLGEVCDLIKRGIAPKYVESGGIVVINQKCIRNHEIDYGLARRNDLDKKMVPDERLIKLGDVLVNSTGTGTLGRVAQVRIQEQFDATVDTHVTIVRPTEGKFYPPFFGYMMRMIEDEIKDAGQGVGGQTELSRDALTNSFSVGYPEDLEEQKRIVAVLDAAFEGLTRAKENAEANLQNARELFESFSGGIVEESLAKYPIVSLADISENLDRQRVPITKKDRVAGEVPYYGASGVVDHVSEYLFDEDLLLVSEDGANLLARTYPIAFSVSGKVWVNNHAHVLRFEDKSQQEFVSMYLNSITLVPFISGMAQPKLNQRSLNTIPIPNVPKDDCKKIAEQANELAKTVERLEANYRTKLTDISDLRQSLLQKAFAGDLT